MKFTKIFAGFVVFAALAVASTASAYVHTTTLKMGSTGTQVMELQKALNAKGFVVSTTGAGSVGMESTYFGTKTQMAVKAFQTANGLTSDGVVGPMTGAKLAMAGGTTGGGTTTGGTCPAGFTCTPVGGGTPVTGLAGTDGVIDTITTLGSYNDEEVGEGSSDTKVAGFEVETSNDGDVSISSIKLTFDPTDNGATDSGHIDDYIDGVSIWMGSTKVGSADADDFTENSNDTYSRTISLSGAIVRADDTEKFYVTVDGVNTFDSGDIDTDDWSVGISSLRYVDGSGVTTTIDGGDTEIGGGDPSEIGWDAVGDGVEIDFVSFSDAADTELVVTVDGDTPEAGIAMVSDTDSTDDVSLLKGNLEAEGDSDIVIDELPITFTATSSGTANGVDDIATNVTLKIGSEEFTETMTLTAALTGTITFDNLDFTIEAGDTVEFEVLADIQDIDGTIFAEGDTLTASLTSTNNDYIDAEDEEGDQLTDDTEKTGTATGETQTLRSSGIQLTFVSASTSVAAGTSTSDDQGTFIIKYKIKAIGDTVYVSSLADATTGANTSGKTSVTVDRAGTATTGGVSTVLANITNADLTATYGLFELTDGEENTFELTTTAQLPTSGAAGLFRAVLSGVRWDTDSTDVTPDNSYTTNLDSFKTSYVGLN